MGLFVLLQHGGGVSGGDDNANVCHTYLAYQKKCFPLYGPQYQPDRIE